MSDWFGKQKTKTQIIQTPGSQAGDAAAQYRLQLAMAIASGNWAPMKGFFDKILIPGTQNALTAAGLGRSGAVGEAVSNAQLSYGGDFLKTLLTGIPVSSPGSTVTSQYQPGGADWLQMALQLMGGLARR